jgi:hypothetical protein
MLGRRLDRAFHRIDAEHANADVGSAQRRLFWGNSRKQPQDGVGKPDSHELRYRHL